MSAQYDALRRADARAAVTPDLGIVSRLPTTAEAVLHGGGTASFPVAWGPVGPDGTVEGVLDGTIGANLNAWVGAAGSTAWDAADKVAFSVTAIRIRATLAVE